MIELNKVLNENEKVLWEGKPDFGPFILSVLPFVLFGMIFLVIGAFAVIQAVAAGQYWALLIPHFWVGVLIVFGAPIYGWLVHKHIHYVITDKRIIFQGGLIGRDFKMVDHDQVSNAEVNVGVWDKLFGHNTGSIMVYTAGTFTSSKNGPVATPYGMANVFDPYTVFKFFKQVSHDVKTDIQYPNQLRPGENLGYRSEYKNPQS